MFALDPADQVLRSSLLDALNWLRHGFGTRRTSNSWQAGTATLRQVHSDIAFQAKDRCDQDEGDALLTNQPGISLSIRTADCVPLLIADPANLAVAAIHAGWKGTELRIAAKVVERMSRDFGSLPESLIAAIGPAIGPCCYEVSQDVAERFASYLPEWSGTGKTHLDLVRINQWQLQAAGVQAGSIDVLDACTRCEGERYHSYRRDAEASGRMHAVIGLLP